MDINFHYFAVKVLAVKAGFTDVDGKGDAQTLAYFSQFVDDYDWFEPFLVYDVPEYARYLATNIKDNLYFFYPVTTGFNFFDYARLVLTQYQKNILIPFHFITKNPLTTVQADRKRYRVEPVKNGGTVLLNNLLDDACNRYLVNPDHENLMRVGTLQHIFADTYAHQRFSGWWGWENNAFLEDVVNNVDMKNITSSYNPNFYYYMPSIGHVNVSTAPDDSNVSFGMQQKYDQHESYPYKAHYSRSNPDVFAQGAREIINYLRQCLGQGPISDADWNNLAPNLNKGFLTAEKDEKKLEKHWSAIFPDIKFSFSKQTLLDPISRAAGAGVPPPIKLPANMGNNATVMINRMSDDFYRYNVICDAIRITVNPPA